MADVIVKRFLKDYSSSFQLHLDNLKEHVLSVCQQFIGPLSADDSQMSQLQAHLQAQRALALLEGRLRPLDSLQFSPVPQPVAIATQALDIEVGAAPLRSPSAPREPPLREFRRALKEDSVEVVRAYLSVRPQDLTERFDNRWTPLHVAAFYDSVQSCKVLVQDFNASLTARDDHQWTPLHVAVHNNSHRCTEVLGLKRELLELPTKHQQTAVHIACERGHIPTLLALAKCGARLNVREKRTDCTPLHVAAAKGFDKIIQLLLDRKVDVAATAGERKWTALHFAAHSGNPTACQVLMQHGASANIVDAMGTTPLMTALAERQEQVALALIPQTDITISDVNNRTAVYFAARFGWARSLQQMLQRLTDPMQRLAVVNQCDNAQPPFSPLMKAIHYGHVECVRILINNGASTAHTSRLVAGSPNTEIRTLMNVPGIDKDVAEIQSVFTKLKPYLDTATGNTKRPLLAAYTLSKQLTSIVESLRGAKFLELGRQLILCTQAIIKEMYQHMCIPVSVTYEDQLKQCRGSLSASRLTSEQRATQFEFMLSQGAQLMRGSVLSLDGAECVKLVQALQVVLEACAYVLYKLPGRHGALQTPPGLATIS
eukprot:TRINITY_DN2354_c0_g1_i1.p1 TRINITY_DN2354_c0_g1~~TRINITY_DN2354_c0_g1_i1.p1  ORF type:complete len:601 (+),score=174.97 TRINITY_DN2354_c0_g1_i1:487-2289(+)